MDPLDDAGDAVIDQGFVAHTDFFRDVGGHPGIYPAKGLQSFLRFLTAIKRIASEDAVRMHAAENPVYIHPGNMVKSCVVFPDGTGHQARIAHFQMGRGEQRFPVRGQVRNKA